jgi:POT family proton-dependent oligopeptide transporter
MTQHPQPSASESARPTSAAPGRMSHPKGLYILFFTEMWERFSYYGMRALLILYRSNHFLWMQEDASRVYKWYTSLVYFTPLVGGFLADRYLGNRMAVIIGAVLMAIGHFLMAFESYAFFFSALLFLILGNGFFKPNMSVQVGRLYAEDDPRRDAAYTIFYMGINLGALFSPLVCGTLGEKWGYHWGFSAAGIGMVIGLLTYLLGQKWIVEVSGGKKHSPDANAATSTANSMDTGNVPLPFPSLSKAGPWIFAALAVAGIVGGPLGWILGHVDLDTMLFSVISGAALAILGFVLYVVHGVARDRTLAIGTLMIFVIVFWFAFEQAGNTMTVWADKHTDRNVFHFGDSAGVAPPSSGLAALEMPASWFQSFNPMMIVLFAPAMAWLWVWLGARGREPSTAMKMAVGVFFVGLSFIAMVIGAVFENRPAEVKLAALPPAAIVEDGLLVYEDEEHGRAPYAGGRLKFDAASGTLHMRGVLPDLDRDRILGDTADATFRKAVHDLVAKSEDLAKRTVASKGGSTGGTPQGESTEVRVPLPMLPSGFDLARSNVEGVRYDSERGELIAAKPLLDRDEKRLRLAGADAAMWTALHDLHVRSLRHRVSVFWLFLSYFLQTVGELCLSPVGLSMVSKLAPARFATLLMGLWLCNSFFANFLAGFMGEYWGKIDPVPFFSIFVIVSLILAVVLWLATPGIRKLMHGVH